MILRNFAVKGWRLLRGVLQLRGIVSSGRIDAPLYFGRSLRVGDFVVASDLGGKKVPADFRKCLRSAGLGLCQVTHRIWSAEDMASDYRSYEGRRRHNLICNARQRAKQKGLPLNLGMVQTMAWGPLPASFHGMPYSAKALRGAPSRMSLTIDRINPSKGYVKGNVRFLPFWLNTVLNIFSDAKARQMAERMVGIRSRFSTELLPEEFHKQARSKVSRKRDHAIHKGVHVGECFTFPNLLQAGKLVTRCPYSGVRLQWVGRTPHDGRVDRSRSVSFDRIDCAGMYSLDNVQVVANCVNTFKSDLAISDMHTLLSALDWLETDDFYSSHIPACTRLEQRASKS